MKRILIVNNNMRVGGVQKSLVNLLWEIHDKYEVTLYLFSKHGMYLSELPEDVRILQCDGAFRYLGVSQGETHGIEALKRGFLALVCRFFGRNRCMELLLSGQKALKEEYDCAIAFLHNGSIRNFYGGVQEFVLEKTSAKRKVAFLHCDYSLSGAKHPYNDSLLSRFDQITACSDSCRDVLLQLLPEDVAKKCTTVRNCHDFPQILRLSEQEPFIYPDDGLNVLMVSRLSHEKAVERGIEAAAYARKQGTPVRLHIVGDGPKRAMLEELAEKLHMQSYVHFHGEHINPYRYMKNADLLLMTSYHEAAPMVIEEALFLGVPVLTTETRSSREWERRYDRLIVCGNAQNAVNMGLLRTLNSVKRGKAAETSIRRPESNQEALAQFEGLLEQK